jgi:hypothetical protein
LEGRAVVQAVVVVGLVVLGVLLVFAVLVARLRARVRRVERDGGETSRSVATVQGWAAKELKALRGQVTAIHANQTAEQLGDARASKRAPSSAAPPMLEEDRPTLEMVAAPVEAEPLEDEKTHVAARTVSIFDADDPPMYAPRPEPPAPRRPRRTETIRPPAPLAHPDLIGSEDIADEATRARLGPDELTPPRRGRAAVLVPSYREPEEGGAA